MVIPAAILLAAAISAGGPLDGAGHESGGGPTRLVIGLAARVGAGELEASGKERASLLARRTGGAVVRVLPFAAVLDVADEAAARARLAGMTGLRWVEREQTVWLVLKEPPTDTHWGDAWHLHPSPAATPGTDLDLEPAWDTDPGARPDESRVRVALLDDGFATTHEDLAGRFAPLGRNFSNGEPYDDDVEPGPGDYHGTHTAGVVAATRNGLGVVGVCPECELLPVRLIGGGGPAGLYAIDSTVAADAIVWAVEAGAEVINNSWGPPDGNPFAPQDDRDLWQVPTALGEALDYAARQGRGGKGAVVVFAAGNGGELVTYDRYASHRAVLAVGAVDAGGRRAWYSDWGPPLALVAPSSGEVSQPKVWTTDLPGTSGHDAGDYYSGYSGTSAAAAMVSGVAALLLDTFPELTAAQVHEALKRGAYPIDAPGGDYDAEGHSPLYGFGRVDAVGALSFAAGYTDGCTLALELCGNDDDDDCDGTVDDGCDPCVPDALRELCDGHDNDCDGASDEDFVCEPSDRPVCAPCGQSSECAVGARCREAEAFYGKFCLAECGAGGECPDGFGCDGEVCQLVPDDVVRDCQDLLSCQMPERCDGVDNDCDGTVDDVDLAGAEAQVVLAGCLGAGVCEDAEAACADGAWECTPPSAYQPSETRCDRLDNDCDGVVDEGCPRQGGCRDCAQSGPGGLVWLIALLLLLRWARPHLAGR